MSILGRNMAQTPYAVIDLETTGLNPSHDRIIEIAIVVVSGSEPLKLVLSTLVNPEMPVTCFEIHGLTDADVVGAPRFADVAQSVAAAIANRVVVSHNISFDMAFLSASLERAGYFSECPHLCSMLFPVAAGIGERESLRLACCRNGVELDAAHTAEADAMAAAALFKKLLRRATKNGVSTFADLAKSKKSYKFLESFLLDPLTPPRAMIRAVEMRRNQAQAREKHGIALYLEAVLDAVADLRIDQSEIDAVSAVKRELEISDGEMRAIHARVFGAMISRYAEDRAVDLSEVSHMRALWKSLSTLGWAPGE